MTLPLRLHVETRSIRLLLALGLLLSAFPAPAAAPPTHGTSRGGGKWVAAPPPRPAAPSPSDDLLSLLSFLRTRAEAENELRNLKALVQAKRTEDLYERAARLMLALTPAQRAEWASKIPLKLLPEADEKLLQVLVEANAAIVDIHKKSPARDAVTKAMGYAHWWEESLQTAIDPDGRIRSDRTVPKGPGSKEMIPAPQWAQEQLAEFGASRLLSFAMGTGNPRVAGLFLTAEPGGETGVFVLRRGGGKTKISVFYGTDLVAQLKSALRIYPPGSFQIEKYRGPEAPAPAPAPASAPSSPSASAPAP